MRPKPREGDVKLSDWKSYAQCAGRLHRQFSIRKRAAQRSKDGTFGSSTPREYFQVIRNTVAEPKQRDECELCPRKVPLGQIAIPDSQERLSQRRYIF
jgi:hypothetical protein